MFSYGCAFDMDIKIEATSWSTRRRDQRLTVFFEIGIPETIGKLPNTKLSHMDKNGFENVVSEITPQFEGLKQLAGELRGVLFPLRDGTIFTGTYHDNKIMSRFAEPYATLLSQISRPVKSGPASSPRCHGRQEQLKEAIITYESCLHEDEPRL
jgi:hypothetical protein